MKKAPQDPQESLVLPVRRVRTLPSLDRLVQPVQRALLAPKVRPGQTPRFPVQRVPQVLKAPQVILVHKDRRVRPDPKDLKVILASRVRPERMVRPEHRDRRATRATPGHKDQWDQQVRRVLRVRACRLAVLTVRY